MLDHFRAPRGNWVASPPSANGGQAGERLSDVCCRALLLDVIVCHFTIPPLIVGQLVAGWSGLLVGVVAQLATLLIWQTIHEAVHRDAAKGSRIVKV
ncbi:MAG: hypothetical protein WBW78_16725, partial [Terrimicrobiaceae bacterium]